LHEIYVVNMIYVDELILKICMKIYVNEFVRYLD